MDVKAISEAVSAKALLRSGLIFRGYESGVDYDNIQLHTAEISELDQSGKGTEGLCATCRDYGLEYLHLLECPAKLGDEKEGPEYQSKFPTHDGYDPEEAFRPEINDALWLQRFDTRSHFQDDCSVCELLLSLLPGDSTGPWRVCWVGYGYYRLHNNQSSFGKRDDLINWQTQRTPVILVAPDDPTGFEEWWKSRRQYGLILPTRRDDEESTIVRARCIDAHLVDFNAAKSWIQTCREYHGENCGSTHRSLPSLKVIDCRTKTIVAAPEICEYVALSYVWGANHVAGLKDLSNWDQMPALIQDAATTTIQLGYDYLWIDFYCIPQDDAVEREKHIHKMDKIYSEAQLTIIAACSEDASIGLSGVSNTRQHSVTATAGRNTLVAIYSKEVKYIKQSKWNTRGWTYQEGLLSRRRLIFTDTGMFFQCIGGEPSKTCATESFDVGLGTEGLRSMVNDQWVFPDIRTVTKFPDTIWNCLGEYTGRTLSYDSDALNAFAGVLNRFAESSTDFDPRETLFLNSSSLQNQPIMFSNSTTFLNRSAEPSADFDHIWGVPVYRKQLHHPQHGGLEFVKDYKVLQTCSERLASSLLWYPAKAELYARRRPEFPSWSWARDIGEIVCDENNIRNLDLDISIEIENGENIRAEKYFSIPASQRPNIAKGLYVDAPVTFVQVDPLLRQDDGLFYSVTSFERQDSIKLHHAGLMILRRMPKGFKPGRHLAVILGASQKTMSLRLTYHLLVLYEKEDHYERAFVLEVNDATLEQRIPEETWANWADEACEVLKINKVPWIWEDHPADFGFKEENRVDWEKVFLIAKHLRVEKRVVYVR